MAKVQQLLDKSRPHFKHWEKIKDVMDQVIDLMLNYRQSGHPGGSRSKVHGMIATTLSGAMRWDIRNPEKRFGDKFVLSAGHTAPLIYSFLCVFGDAMRTRHGRTGDGGGRHLHDWSPWPNPLGAKRVSHRGVFHHHVHRAELLTGQRHGDGLYQLRL